MTASSEVDRPRNARRALLVGAGHAHLHVIRHAGAFTRRGFELVVLAPDAFWYSGLATGMLGGTYEPEQDRVEVDRLAARGGGRFVRDRASAIDPAARLVHRAAGPPLAYDVLSLNLGSEVPAETIPGLAEHGRLVKPIRNLWDLRRDVEDRLRMGQQPRIVIAGGGPTACELAGNLSRLRDDRQGEAVITVLAGGKRLLEALPHRAERSVLVSLGRRGVRFETGWRVSAVEPGVAIADDGRREPFDLLVGAIGLRPSPLVRSTGLPVDDEGALQVDDALRSVADPTVFGGGDCISLQGHKLARVGVYAVREAPLLLHNLLATLDGQPLRPFRPQRRFLLILNLGDGTGLATWGPFAWHSHAAFWLKDAIDRRFLARYRASPVR